MYFRQVTIFFLAFFGNAQAHIPWPQVQFFLHSLFLNRSYNSIILWRSRRHYHPHHISGWLTLVYADTRHIINPFIIIIISSNSNTANKFRQKGRGKIDKLLRNVKSLPVYFAQHHDQNPFQKYLLLSACIQLFQDLSCFYCRAWLHQAKVRKVT